MVSNNLFAPLQKQFLWYEQIVSSADFYGSTIPTGDMIDDQSALELNLEHVRKSANNNSATNKLNGIDWTVNTMNKNELSIISCTLNDMPPTAHHCAGD